MKKRFKTESEILKLVDSFEKATISREEWRHAEHVIVALYYLTHHDLKAATEKMRDGIMNLLTNGFSVDLTKEMPYHETMTVFWMRTVAKFAAIRENVPLLEKANEIADLYDKDYPLNFYSRELLFSDRARAKYVEPDLASAGPASYS